MVTKTTRSLLEELDRLYIERDRKMLIENRATNAIHSVVRLIEQIEQEYPADQAENLTRKLLNAIKSKDPDKFTRSIRRTHKNQDPT